MIENLFILLLGGAIACLIAAGAAALADICERYWP